MKKLICFALLAVLAICLLGACENVAYPGESAVSEEESAETSRSEIINILPPPVPTDETSQAEPQSCRIVTTQPGDFGYSETNPAMVNTLIRDRDETLRSRYNIEVTVIASDYATVAEKIKNALSSGDRYAEMIALPASETVKLYISGLLYDMNSLPGFDATSALFDSRNAASLATFETLYMLPDPSAQYYEQTNVLFYNRDMLDTTLGDPEVLVQKGEWTWDRFSELAKTAAAVSKGVYGFAAYYENDDIAYPIWMSAGRHIVGDTYKNTVVVGMNANDMASVAVGLTKHYNVSYIYPNAGDDAASAFEHGMTPFLFNKLSYLYALRDGTEKGLNYGFLPMPKYEKEQDYACLVGRDALVISVPAAVANYDDEGKARVSALVSTVCGMQGTMSSQAFVGTVLMSYLSTNSETVMLQTVCDSAVFDFAWIYGGGISAVAGSTVRAVCDYILFGSQVQNTVNMYLPSFNRYATEHFNVISSENA